MLAHPKPEPREKKQSGGLRRNSRLQAKTQLKSSGPKKPPKPKAKREPNPLKVVDHKPKNTIPADFPPAVRRAIKQRDNCQCVYEEGGERCALPVEGIHHVTFKSQGGLGTEDNGVLVCNLHHRWAHGLVKIKPKERPDAGRRYMERYIAKKYGRR